MGQKASKGQVIIRDLALFTIRRSVTRLEMGPDVAVEGRTAEEVRKSLFSESEQRRMQTRLRELFATYDGNGNGVLERDEALRFFRDAIRVGVEVGVQVQNEMMRALHIDRKLDLRDVMRDLERQLPQMAELAFDEYDTNKDGQLSWQEFCDAETVRRGAAQMMIRSLIDG